MLDDFHSENFNRKRISPRRVIHHNSMNAYACLLVGGRIRTRRGEPVRQTLRCFRPVTSKTDGMPLWRTLNNSNSNSIVGLCAEQTTGCTCVRARVNMCYVLYGLRRMDGSGARNTFTASHHGIISLVATHGTECAVPHQLPRARIAAQ